MRIYFNHRTDRRFEMKEFDEDNVCDFIAEQRYFDTYYNLSLKIQNKITAEAKEIIKKWNTERTNQ